MFAFALHDMRRDRVLIARDRLGKKPVYYHHAYGRLSFASEIKALLECPHVPREPDLAGVDAYLTLRYSPGPESMFAGILKLPAAHRMVWEKGKLSIERYWDPAPGDVDMHDGDHASVDRFAREFEESVRLRMIADVPIGAFLSGGVDSAAIVAAMARNSAKVNTFSIGFAWEGDELAAAREVATRLGCVYHETMCRQEDMALLPRIIWALDEPVGDPIVVPMYQLSQLARQHVTVALSGEGADEVLGGYLMHKTMMRGRQLRRVAPGPLLRHIAQPLISALPISMLDTAFDYPGTVGPRSRRKIAELVGHFGDAGIEQTYSFMISLFDPQDKRALYAASALVDDGRAGLDRPDPKRWSSFLQQMLSVQYRHWLPDDILTKFDKMTMANSLEGRTPFLDHRFVHYANRLPDQARIRGGRNKAILRDYLDQVLPGGVSARPKKAFYVPLEAYVERGPLKEMIDQCLSEESVRRRGWFHWDGVRRLREQQASDFMWEKQLFSLLALELWARIYLDRESGWV
jgi:asparagine synthase (glutamine-hydrolysing)